MKSLIRRLLVPAVFAAAMTWNCPASAQWYQGGMERYAVLTIKADGSCLFNGETVESRVAAEQQVRLMERYQKMSEGGEEGAPPAEADLSATNSAAEAKPFTDEELTKNDRLGERTHR